MWKSYKAKKVNELYVYVKDVCPVRDKVKKKKVWRRHKCEVGKRKVRWVRCCDSMGIIKKKVDFPDCRVHRDAKNPVKVSVSW